MPSSHVGRTRLRGRVIAGFELVEYWDNLRLANEGSVKDNESRRETVEGEYVMKGGAGVRWLAFHAASAVLTFHPLWRMNKSRHT